MNLRRLFGLEFHVGCMSNTTTSKSTFVISSFLSLSVCVCLGFENEFETMRKKKRKESRYYCVCVDSQIEKTKRVITFFLGEKQLNLEGARFNVTFEDLRNSFYFILLFFLLEKKT